MSELEWCGWLPVDERPCPAVETLQSDLARKDQALLVARGALSEWMFVTDGYDNASLADLDEAFVEAREQTEQALAALRTDHLQNATKKVEAEDA